MLKESPFRNCVPGSYSSLGLRKLPLPGSNRLLWAALSNQEETAASPTVDVHVNPALPAAHIGRHLSASQQLELTILLSRHADTFALREDDVGLN